MSWKCNKHHRHADIVLDVDTELNPPLPASEDADKVLLDIDKCIEENGLEGVQKEFDLNDLYKSGYLRGGDMDFFLLSLLNHSKEDGRTARSVSSDMLTREGGKLVNVNKLAENILEDCLVINILEALSPRDAMRYLVNQLRRAKGHKKVVEADGSRMRYVIKKFENWGRTVETNEIYTFMPRTKVGVCNVVKWARSKSLKVRAAGYRHSWSDIIVNDNQVLISLLPLKYVEKLPANEVPIDPKNELQGIELLDEYVREDGTKKRLCKIGSATTNEQFREWVIENSLDEKDAGNKKWDKWWTLPLNVIMVEITFGGSNGPICHGAGRTTTTLSDLVTSIEFVNCKGELQIVDCPAQLKSVSGCFGMMGIVTSITMKLDPLTFARMIPEKKHIALSIPPPDGFDIPHNIDMSGITKNKLDRAFAEFKDRCDNWYYTEYFWFPSHEECWLNCWRNDGCKEDATDYPCPVMTKYQESFSFLQGILNSNLFSLFPGYIQMKVMTTFAMLDLPEREKDDPIVTPLIEALHFRRGIQNMRCRDMEWEIPIPGLKEDPSQPDYTVCQKAWWGVIKAFYDRFNKCKHDVPMRLPLEMRITGGSEVHIAPQYGNHEHGTLSIEILTPKNVDDEKWFDFMQEVTDIWTNLRGDDGRRIHPIRNREGQLLYPRPHWAKEWEGLTVRGEPIKQYLRNKACKEQIPLFRDGLIAAARDGGYDLNDSEAVFATKFSQEMFIDSQNDGGLLDSFIGNESQLYSLVMPRDEELSKEKCIDSQNDEGLLDSFIGNDSQIYSSVMPKDEELLNV